MPGLPEAAKAKGLDPLAYMRKYGAFEVIQSTYKKHERKLTEAEKAGAEIDAATKIVAKDGKPVGIEQDGVDVEGFPTPSRQQELYSQTMVDWGWPEYALPGYIESHVDSPKLNFAAGEFCLLPTFRLPTLIHTRSGAAKWLNEIAQCNPLWLHPSDCDRLGLRDGDLARVTTEIGYFVDRVWLTEAIRPGVAACSHHLGRWRRAQDAPSNRYSANVVDMTQQRAGPMAGAATRRPAAVRKRRSGFIPRLVARRRRAAESDIPRASRSDQRHALLAPARDHHSSAGGRSLRRPFCRHE